MGSAYFALPAPLALCLPELMGIPASRSSCPVSYNMDQETLCMNYKAYRSFNKCLNFDLPFSKFTTSETHREVSGYYKSGYVHFPCFLRFPSSRLIALRVPLGTCVRQIFSHVPTGYAQHAKAGMATLSSHIVGR